MRNDTRVAQILEEVVASGREPAEVCRGSMDLLPAVLENLGRLRAIEAEVEAIFPTSGRSTVPADVDFASCGASLPDVPGYNVLGVLGRGGMGVVYEARHVKLNRTVAVKMLLAGGFASPAELTRFTREAQAIAGLRHPHIVQIYEIGDLNGRPYFTMEFVEGGSLAQRLAGEPQPASDAASMMATLADAIQIAHNGGIIHRDLKPANILLTANGTPKISDFGLARRYDDDSDLTLGGTRLGTPSYMSPEQAIGKEGTIGPASDIYSLGAVMYEMLTGRPPFRGVSPAETERQLLRDDPVPPRLLNTRIPRDLEVICLKCLHKLPAGRYAAARDLADDLRRHLAGEPIAARPVGPVERVVKWARRSPARAALAGVCVIGAVAAGVASTWALAARASRIAAIEADLAAGLQMERNGVWRDAASALDRAAVRLADEDAPQLRVRIDRAKAELALVDRLDSIRLLRAGSAAGVLNNERADREYADAFRSAGLGEPGAVPAEVAGRIGDAPIASALIGALDDWALATRDAQRREWIVNVASLADRTGDPQGWRLKARDPAQWASKESIARLAAAAPVDQQPITFLYAFSEAMGAAGVENLPFLTRAQAAHPSDFWLTTALANAYKRLGRHEEALGYYRAGVALRPDAMVAHYNLGRELGELGKYEEAIRWFRAALTVDPDAVDPLKSLGLTLSNLGQTEQALAIYDSCLSRDPNDWLLHLQKSLCNAKLERFEDAAVSYRRALQLGPAKWRDRAGARDLILKSGHQALACSLWKKQLAEKTTDLNDWDGYAELCLFVEDPAEYKRAREVLLDRFGDATDPNTCERLGRACLLLPPSSPEQLSRVSFLIDRALASEATKRTWAYAYFRFARALVDLRAGDYAAAAQIAEGESAGILGPAPRLVSSICRARMGDMGTARRRLAEASLAFDWTCSAADSREAWIYHVLRREAERLAFPDLDRLLSGQSEPGDEEARVCLMATCQGVNRTGRCAALGAAMLVPGSTLPERFAEPLARALVAAGSGFGSDAADYSDADRTAWRESALTLFAARLDDLERQARSGAMTADAVASAVSAWSDARQFDAVRADPPRVPLASQERSRWIALWSRARALGGAPNQPQP